MQKTLIQLLSVGLSRDPAGVVVSYILPWPPAADKSELFPDIDALLLSIFPDHHELDSAPDTRPLFKFGN